MRHLAFSFVAILVVASLVERSLAGEAVGTNPPKRQIVLSVRMMELDRTQLLRTPGEVDEQGRLLRWAKVFNAYPDFLAAGYRREVMAGCTLADDVALNALLDDWRRLKLLKVLAEPTLVALEGEPCTFFTGGILKVPMPQSLGQVTWEERRIGTSVDFVGTIDEQERIQLKIYPRHSRISPDLAVTGNGYTLPYVRISECNTTAMLRSGQTLVVSGMRQHLDIDGKGHEVDLLLLVQATIAPPGAEVANLATPSVIQLLPSPKHDSSTHSAEMRRRTIRGLFRR